MCPDAEKAGRCRGEATHFPPARLRCIVGAATAGKPAVLFLCFFRNVGWLPKFPDVADPEFERGQPFQPHPEREAAR